MLGAIIGDVCGSFYESRRHSVKSKDIQLIVPESRFTDDTVLTTAVADTILHGLSYRNAIKKWFRMYPNAGFGGGFRKWAAQDTLVDNDSFGNGAAMRVSPVAWAYNDMVKMLEQARFSALPSHAHPEGIKGAQATALAIWLAKNGHSKDSIRQDIAYRFDYDLSRTVDQIRPNYHFSSHAQDSVPEAIICFLDSTSFEDAIRNAISLGGDADTQAAIAGAIAEAFYGGVDKKLEEAVVKLLPNNIKSVLAEFTTKYKK